MAEVVVDVLLVGVGLGDLPRLLLVVAAPGLHSGETALMPPAAEVLARDAGLLDLGEVERLPVTELQTNLDADVAADGTLGRTLRGLASSAGRGSPPLFPGTP